MKSLVLTLSLSFICNSSFSQTYFTPSIGYDFMSMESVFIAPDFHGFEVLNPPYSIKGLQYGIEIEQTIYDKLSASFYLNFARRQAEASIYSPVSLDGFEFDYWRGNVSLNYLIISYLTIGIGYDYNQLKDLTYTFQEQTYSKFKSLMIDQGLNVSIRGYWKNIEFKGYFHKGINSNISESPHELSIKPINYFGFSLGYRIKIINSFKRDKKAECPTF
jgi:hypothetical protein